jgi:tryptophan-rich sensory protein
LLAFIEIILLWAAIIATIYYFSRISKAAAYLLVPYILWVSFAAVLNLSVYLLN